jgi:hypothetical protein
VGSWVVSVRGEVASGRRGDDFMDEMLCSLMCDNSAVFVLAIIPLDAFLITLIPHTNTLLSLRPSLGTHCISCGQTGRVEDFALFISSTSERPLSSSARWFCGSINTFSLVSGSEGAGTIGWRTIVEGSACRERMERVTAVYPSSPKPFRDSAWIRTFSSSPCLDPSAIPRPASCPWPFACTVHQVVLLDALCRQQRAPSSFSREPPFHFPPPRFRDSCISLPFPK